MIAKGAGTWTMCLATRPKTTQRYAHLSQDTLIDAANVVPFTMALPMVAMVKAGSSGLMLGFR